MNGDYVMVIPDELPVSIGSGPKVATYREDFCGPEFMEVWVNGRKLAMATPWPAPQPVPNSPYEAFVQADWQSDRFAIRLREDYDPQEMQ